MKSKHPQNILFILFYSLLLLVVAGKGFAILASKSDLHFPHLENVARAEIFNDDNQIYNVVTEDAASNEFSFAIMGDTQGFDSWQENDSLKKAVAAIDKKNVDLVMTVGDLVPQCSQEAACLEKIEQWKNITSPLHTKIFTVMGNHDRSGNAFADSLWQAEFNMPKNGPAGYEELVYSFDYANAHFVVLNSEKDGDSLIGPGQRAWLDSDLASTDKVHTFVFFHQPAFPMSTKFESSLDIHKKDRDELWHILDKHKVTAVFNGHEHVVSLLKVDKDIFKGATNKLWQVNVGATEAGTRDYPEDGEAQYYYGKKVFTLVNVSDKHISLSFHKPDGEKIKTFELDQSLSQK